MNDAQLLAAFNLLGDAPETIQQLRKLLVCLAVAGKLGEGNKAGTNTLALKKRIEERNLNLRASARSRESAAGITADDLPAGFANLDRFVRLGSIAKIEKGLTGIMKAQPGPFPLVVTAEERSTCDHFDFEGAAAIIPLVSSAGHGKASIQRLHYQEGKFALGTILAAVFPYDPDLISARFLYEYLTAFKEELLVSRMIGTANVSLSIGKISEIPVPIVDPVAQATVDKLMALCDQLEVARREREAKRDRLAAATLARLNEPDPDTFADDARFALDNLTALIARPDQVKQLRQVVLNLAVRGKLVPRHPDDEPTLVMFNRNGVRGRLSGPFDLPVTWEWARVGDVANARLGKMLDKAKNKGNPQRYLRNINVRWFDFDLSDLLEMPFEDSELPEFELRQGDVLICEGGEPGRAAVWDDRERGIYFQKALHRVRFKAGVDPHYFVLALRASANDGRLVEYFTGTGIKHFTGKGLNSYIFPLPPISEQHRIVAKVNELMALCDRLETGLTRCDEVRCRLPDGLLAEALAPGDGSNEPDTVPEFA